MRYCEMCEAYTSRKECKACGAETVKVPTDKKVKS
jgi:rRNA maturation protein Nop10